MPQTKRRLTAHVADPRAPESMTQAVHRALELSALSETGHVVMYLHAGERPQTGSLDSPATADSLANAGVAVEAVLVSAHPSGRGRPTTAQEALAHKYRVLREEFEALGLVITSTMRVRDPRFGDRKVRVEYFQDPDLQGSVLMRLTPTSPLVPRNSQAADRSSTAQSGLPVEGLTDFALRSEVYTGGPRKKLADKPTLASGAAEAAHWVREAPAAYATQPVKPRRADSALIRTTEVAQMLGVSRPYITKLCDLGVFGPVQKTEGGQRRIPLAAVLAYQAQRRNQNQVLDEMAASETSARARAIELQGAEQTVAEQGIRWTKVIAEAAVPSAPSVYSKTGKLKTPVVRDPATRGGTKRVAAKKTRSE